MQTPTSVLQQLRSGVLVRVRGDRWRIEDGRAFPDCRLIRLAGAGRANRGRRLAVLYPFDRPRPIEPSTRLRRVGRRRWLRALRALVGSATPFGRLRTGATARIDLHAYQLEPTLAILNGLATRLLLADQVGLGKTIQAALVISELRSRDLASRILVLTPSGLRDQWASELHDRFSIDAIVVDAGTLRRTAAQIAAGTNPWSVWPVAIASLDFVKRPEVLRALDPFTWEALIVDEAHTCASAPERSAAVRCLAARARHVVLLTATPHAGDDEAFAALCRIGETDAAGTERNPAKAGSHSTDDRDIECPDHLVMFRRTRPDVGLAQNRRVRLFRVPCTADERRMHDVLERYTRAVWISALASAEARLAMIVLRKRALSSASSLVRSLERRLDALSDEGPLGVQFTLPFAGSAEPDDQTPEDDEPMGYLAAPGMESRREREWLTRVLVAARRAARRESKMAWLFRFVRLARQPAVIFTEYRDTARWLAGALRTLGPVVILHGGLSRTERAETERAFASGVARILVATDAAGEGLNLQHRCRLVVNLELPWNPMRLEQRIGRVDRLGQRRRPHAVHLVADSTAEERIVRRLLFRQERARKAVGGVADVLGITREEEMARAVMSDAIELAPAAARRAVGTAPHVSTIDLREMATDEVRRLELLRAIAGRRQPGTAPAVPDAVSEAALSVLPHARARRSGLRSGVLICVFVVRLIAADEGEVLHELLVPLQMDPSGSFAFDRLDRNALEDLVRSDALRDRVLSLASGRLEAARALHRVVLHTARAREEALILVARGRAVPVQPGMFDRRVLRHFERERDARMARASEEADRLAWLEHRVSSDPVARVEPRLVLIIER